jgi:A/G-specific adenine glycosylase
MVQQPIEPLPFELFRVSSPATMSPHRIVPLLLEWFGRNARDLPWRRTRDPYAIWVSEIMLQQTQVKTVVPFWDRWMAALPTIRSLARAKPQKIHKLWEGLGYYTRVRNMQRAARLILKNHGGQFPATFDDVLQLPGIGRYTAGAVCSIAFNQPQPILDGNVIRLLSRAFAIDGNPRDRAVNAKLWELADCLVKQAHRHSTLDKTHAPSKRRSVKIANGSTFCSHLNQSLMELGALVCTPRKPRCDQCPLGKSCLARKQRLIEVLPNLAPRPGTTRRRFVAFVVRRGAEVLVRQRPAGVVNAHLWEFPNSEVSNGDVEPRKAALTVSGVILDGLTPLCTIRHSITRYRIRLDVFEARPAGSVDSKSISGRWVRRNELHRLAFASAHKKILAHIANSKGISS